MFSFSLCTAPGQCWPEVHAVIAAVKVTASLTSLRSPIHRQGKSMYKERRAQQQQQHQLSEHGCTNPRSHCNVGGGSCARVHSKKPRLPATQGSVDPYHHGGPWHWSCTFQASNLVFLNYTYWFSFVICHTLIYSHVTDSHTRYIKQAESQTLQDIGC